MHKIHDRKSLARPTRSAGRNLKKVSFWNLQVCLSKFFPLFSIALQYDFESTIFLILLLEGSKQSRINRGASGAMARGPRGGRGLPTADAFLSVMQCMQSSSCFVNLYGCYDVPSTSVR